ncbi:MAG: hypothetical protein QW420_06395 [Candidatus Caldarchaeum sp.]
MRNVGLALIAIGLLLIVLPPLGILRGATLNIVPPDQVWVSWSPRADDPSTPFTYSLGSVIGVGAHIQYVASDFSWSLPGGCSDYRVNVLVYTSTNTLKKNLTLNLAQSSLQYRCESSTGQISTTELGLGDYRLEWSLIVLDSSGQRIGTVQNPKKTYIRITAAPDGYFTINDMRADQNTYLLLSAAEPVRFKFTATAHPDQISEVKVFIFRKGTSTQVAEVNLSKTSTTTWEGSWQPTAGIYDVYGYIYQPVPGGKTSYRKMSIVMDFGGEGGGGLSLNPLQLLGLLAVVTGVLMVVRSRR